MNPSCACSILFRYLAEDGRNDIMSLGGFLPSSDPSFASSANDWHSKYVYSAMPLLSAVLKFPASVSIRTRDSETSLTAVEIRVDHSRITFMDSSRGINQITFNLADLLELKMARASDLQGRKSMLGRILDSMED